MCAFSTFSTRIARIYFFPGATLHIKLSAPIVSFGSFSNSTRFTFESEIYTSVRRRTPGRDPNPLINRDRSSFARAPRTHPRLKRIRLHRGGRVISRGFLSRVIKRNQSFTRPEKSCEKGSGPTRGTDVGIFESRFDPPKQFRV